MPQGGDIIENFEIKHLHVNQYLNLVPHFLRMFSIVNLTRLMLFFLPYVEKQNIEIIFPT
jgi:hypothetical protein